MTTAKEAKEHASLLMDQFPKKKLLDYIYHWNELLLYLEAQVRKEAQNDNPKQQ